MDSKEKISEVVSDSTEKLEDSIEKIEEKKEKIEKSEVSEKIKTGWLDHVRSFFTKEKHDFDGLTQVRQGSFLVSVLLMLSLLSGVVGGFIVLSLSLGFLFLGIQGETFSKKIMPHLPKIFFGAFMLVVSFWIISFYFWMITPSGK